MAQSMNIGIVGAGPAGLYFALLMKQQNPAHQIRVVEQNAAGATYGWGVVFSDRALSFLAAADPDSYRDIERRLQTCNPKFAAAYDAGRLPLLCRTGTAAGRGGGSE
jgi:2-polyprenyl-6-methoxyphenol hydroxylase-like FAD-dependent oxidoreductase